MGNKILSLVIPSYNMEEYLPKCLGSLIVDDKELLQKLDVIVVNDGSRDRTSEIAHGYEASFPGVFRVIDKANGHYGSCVNAGIRIASGLYVKILDADDTFDKVPFERYLKFIERLVCDNNRPDLIFNDFDEVNEKGVLLRHYSYAFTASDDFSLSDLHGRHHSLIWHHAIAYRLAMIREADYLQVEGTPYSDQQWDTIPLMSVRTMAYCPETIYRYLIGRVGQSCEAEVRLRDFSKHLVVASAILKDYVRLRRGVSKANLDAVIGQLEANLRFIYVTYLMLGKGVLDEADLVSFDRALKELCPDLFAITAGFTMTGGFRYVAEWRRHYSTKTVKFKVYRMVRNFVCRLRGVR